MTTQTLVAAKPQLQKDLKDLLEKACYEAEMTAVTNSSAANPEIMKYVNGVMDEAAKAKAKKFAEVAYEPLAEAIHNFVKEIGIVLVPTGTLMSPTGPVSGAASTMKSDFTIV